MMMMMMMRYSIAADRTTVAIFILICSPNISFVVRLVSDKSLENFEVGNCHPATPRKISTRGLSSCVRFDLLSSINFRDINGVPKLETRTLIRVT